MTTEVTRSRFMPYLRHRGSGVALPCYNKDKQGIDLRNCWSQRNFWQTPVCQAIRFGRSEPALVAHQGNVAGVVEELVDEAHVGSHRTESSPVDAAIDIADEVQGYEGEQEPRGPVLPSSPDGCFLRICLP